MTSRLRARLDGRAGLCALALAAGLAAPLAPALAQDAPVTAAPPSDIAMVNLVRMLIAKGVLTQDAGDQLIRQAEAEAEQAHGSAQTVATAPGVAPTQMAALPAAPAGTVRVPYVPPLVREQIKEEVKAEVIAEAKDQHWIAPNLLPDWVNVIKLSGDFRVRDQFDLYSGNNSDDFVDYATFNSGGPTDINPLTNPGGVPQLNTRSDRLDQLRIRARLGLFATLGENVDVGVRLASGQDSSPVSTNQALGGGLSKKAIWLDQAWVDLRPVSFAKLTLGRMPNPFLSTDLVYDEDLNIDGAAVSLASRPLDENGFGVRAVGGAFPIEYGATNFPTTDPDKAGTDAKWMYGGQIEGDWKSDRIAWRLAVAYYGFSGAQGELSSPCGLYTGQKFCDTDQTRPAFMQKGNSLFLIRDIVADPSDPTAIIAQPQFVGLVQKFDLLDLTSTFDWRVTDAEHLTLTADYVKNLSYDASAACRYAPLGEPVTNLLAGSDGAGGANFDPCGDPPTGGTKAVYQSGDTGWMVKATFGYPRTLARGQWNITAGYKYLQPDAVLDAFTDSDFHLGGTNAKGYFIAAQLGIYRNTWLTARWLSADAVYGPPLNIDVAQIDLNIGF